MGGCFSRRLFQTDGQGVAPVEVKKTPCHEDTGGSYTSSISLWTSRAVSQGGIQENGKGQEHDSADDIECRKGLKRHGEKCYG